MKSIYDDNKSKKISEELRNKVESNPLTMLVALPNSGRASWFRSQATNEIIIDLAADKALDSWIVEENIESDKKIVFMINSLDVIDRENRYNNWKKIITLYYRYPTQVKLILGMGSEEVENAKDLLRDLYPYFVSNKVWMPLMDEEDMDNFGLADKDLQIRSGGYLPLVKRSLEIGKLQLDDEVVDFALETLWEALGSASQNQLKMLTLNQGKEFSDYLAKTGVVKNKQLFLPLFSEWIKKMMANDGVKLEVVEGKIMLEGGVDLEKILSFQEYEVLKKLWQSKENIVSRNEVADVLWGSKAEENYSDWAIDQVISKLRRKIGDVGEKRLIETAKGKGFIIGK